MFPITSKKTKMATSFEIYPWPTAQKSDAAAPNIVEGKLKASPRVLTHLRSIFTLISF